MNRQARLTYLKQIIASGAWRTQGELVDALSAAGWEVTQSSVSRDIKALGLEKVDGVYVLPGGVRADRAGVALPWAHVQSVVTAGEHMVVLRTHTATAQQVAAAIDGSAWEGVAGTIAGDDTVFVATTSAQLTAELVGRLRTSAGLVMSRLD